MGKKTKDQDNSFEDYSISSIPSHWNVKELHALFDVQSGKALSEKTRHGKPQHPFLRTSNVYWGRIDLSTLDHMRLSPEEIVKLHLHYWDLLVCEGGDIGRTGIWKNNISEICAFQNHIHRLRRKDNEVWPEFYLFWMEYAIRLRGSYTGEGITTTIPNLSKGKVEALKIPQPPLDEQKNIVTILSKIQQNIQHQEKIITVLKNMKQSITQKIFHDGTKNENLVETELGLLPESWNVQKIEDHYDFTKKPRKLQYSDFEEIPFVPMDLVPIGSVVFEKFILKKPEEISSGTYFEKGDLLIAKITPSFENGKQGILENLPADFGIATTEVIPIKDRQNESDKFFLYYYLLKSDVRNFLTNKMDGSTGRQRISKELLESLPIPFPDINEQREISSIINSVEQKIILSEKKHFGLENLFKTMLNSLMRGEINISGGIFD